MGLLDVLRGVESEENIGEEEEQEDIGGSQEREEQRAGLLGGLFNNLKEFVGVEDDDDAEPPPIEAEGTGTEMHLNAINAPEEFDFLPDSSTMPPRVVTLPPLELGEAHGLDVAGDAPPPTPPPVVHDYIEIVKRSMNGDLEYLHRAVVDGADMFVVATINIRDDDGSSEDITVSPLQAAAQGNHSELINFLLVQAGIRVDDCAGDTRAWTALFYAADDANTEAMETLLTQPTEKKANPNHRDTKGNTPLHVVCKTEWLNFNDQLEMVNLLLDNGADVNLRNNKTETPLMLLVSRQHTHQVVLDRLLQVGSGEDDNGPSVELDIKDHKRNDTALHRSIMHNNVAAFEALTDAGADLMIVNKPPDRKDAMTPLLAALAKAQFAQWLLDHPKYLQSVSLILSLVSIFEYNSKKNPAFGPEFRALAESASALTLKLLDLCEDKEAHYLITGPKVPSGAGVLAHRFGDLEADALDTAIDLNHPAVKPFLAHRCVHNELTQLWIGREWDHQKQAFAPPSHRKWWTVTPQRSMQFFNFFYFAYLFTWCADVIYKKRRVNADSWSATEIATYTYMLGFALKEAYSVVRQRLSYFDEKWNVMDAILITLHLGTFILRVSPGDKGMAPLNMEQRRNGMNPDDNPSFYQDIYTLILSVNLLISTARLLWMFNFDPTLGPLQLMMARMVKDVFRFLVLFVVAFAGFVLAIYQMCRHSEIEEVATVSATAWQLVWATLGNPDTSWITYDNLNSDMLVYGTMTLYALYLFLSTVMLINLLIAMMSSTYDTIQVNVDVEWKAEWAIMVKFLSREQSMLEFSPPLNLLFVPYWIGKKLYRWRQSMRQVHDVWMYGGEKNMASPHRARGLEPEESKEGVQEVIDSVTAVVRAGKKKVRDVGSTADGTRGVDVPTEQSIAKEEADAKRRAVEIFQEVAQKYTDKQNSDPEREEREKNASHMQGLLVENQELLQELKNLLITVPGIKRPHQTASDATGSLTPGGGTKGGTQLHHQHLHSHASFLSPKGPASSSLASTGESALLLSSATMGLGASRRNVMNLPPLRSKSDLGGSAASDTVRSGGPGVPAEGTTVTTVTRNKQGKKKKSTKADGKKTPPKTKK